MILVLVVEVCLEWVGMCVSTCVVLGEAGLLKNKKTCLWRSSKKYKKTQDEWLWKTETTQSIHYGIFLEWMDMEKFLWTDFDLFWRIWSVFDKFRWTWPWGQMILSLNGFISDHLSMKMPLCGEGTIRKPRVATKWTRDTVSSSRTPGFTRKCRHMATRTQARTKKSGHNDTGWMNCI